MNDSLESDKEYLNKLGIKSFYPPASITIEIMKKAIFQPCKEQGSAREALLRDASGWDVGDKFHRYEGPEDYVFVSLQHLAPLFFERGYDIRPGMVDFSFELVESMKEAIAAKASAPEPLMAGSMTVNGQMGLVVTREWLKSAGINPRIGRSWQSEVSPNLTDGKSMGMPDR